MEICILNRNFYSYFQILLQDGYFIHFFAPNDLDPLPKHIVFVLDTSGSMSGTKIQQLKDAMMNILSDLRKEDMLSIIEFNNDVIIWDVDSKKSTTVPVDKIADFKEPFAYLQVIISLESICVRLLPSNSDFSNVYWLIRT